jgi:class 3 adenylate cyclase
MLGIFFGGPLEPWLYFGYLGFGGLILFYCSLLYFHEDQDFLRKVKNRVFLAAIILFGIGLIGLMFEIPYRRMYIILSVLVYCFFYAPLEMKYKIQKWKVYSKNNVELLGLSLIDFLGINLILLGALNRFLHWPGQFSLIYLGLLFLIIGVIFWNRRFKVEVIRRKKAEDQIKAEKEKSEELLHNILPREVAEELKEKGASEAKDFDEVTVLFSDFKEFTQTAKRLSAKELVSEINACFKAFDAIMQKYQIEKIKTIGDAYMAAGGLHKPRTSEPKDVVLAGLEMQEFMLSRKAEREAQDLPYFDMRVGIHTGPVVAGIVGVKKFQYDIWGDTVNTASRMESHGEIGKVNVSNSTYEILKDNPVFHFESRGKSVVKGLGETEMWFVSKKLKP